MIRKARHRRAFLCLAIPSQTHFSELARRAAAMFFEEVKRTEGSHDEKNRRRSPPQFRYVRMK
jgi:hypothetical protein